MARDVPRSTHPLVSSARPENLSAALGQVAAREDQRPAGIDAAFHLGGTSPAAGSHQAPLVPTNVAVFTRSSAIDTVLWACYGCKLNDALTEMSSSCRTSAFCVLGMQSKQIKLGNPAPPSIRASAAVGQSKASEQVHGYVVSYAASSPQAEIQNGVSMPALPVIAAGPTALCIAPSSLTAVEGACCALAAVKDQNQLYVAFPSATQLGGRNAVIESSEIAASGIHALMKVAEAEVNDDLSVTMERVAATMSVNDGRLLTSASAHQASKIDGGISMLPKLLARHSDDNTDILTPFSGRAVITGAFGALGQLVAWWLSAAQSSPSFRLVLLGRHAAVHANEFASTSQGTAEVSTCDAAFQEDVACAVQTDCAPVQLFHASGALQDGMLNIQSVASMRKVFAPKTGAAEALMQALIGFPVKTIVLFSSLAALLGNVGQSNYAAANGALDAIAQIVQASGVLAASLQWGPWDGKGMASEAVARRLKKLGLGLVQPGAGLRAMAQLLGARAVTEPVLAYADVRDWSLALRPAQHCYDTFAEVLPPAAPKQAKRNVAPRQTTLSLSSILETVRSTAAATIGTSHLDDDATFMAAGLDSLGSTELRNALSTKFSVDLPATVAFDYPTPSALAAQILSLAAPAAAAADPVQLDAGARGSVEQRIAAIVRDIVGDSVGLDDPLMQAGLDSLGATELQRTISTQFQINVPATLAFDYPSVKALAEFVVDSGSVAFDTAGVLHHLELASAQQSDTVVCFSSVACSYPGAQRTSNPEAFYEALGAGKDFPHQVPSTRWDVDAFYDPATNAAYKMYVRFGCWLEGIDAFDPEPFRLSQAEAVGVDPQTRLLMERGYEALGALNTHQDASSVGVYVGCMYTEYLDGVLGMCGLADSAATSIVGHGMSFMVGRLSFTFALRGPCISTDTACSSSLVAAHLGRQGIMEGEAASALVGGVNLMLIPQTSARICLLQALSPVGRCKALDSSADGYGRGEAVALGLLSLLEVTNEDHVAPDTVLAGTGVQQCGRSSGLTAPNGPAQTSLIQGVLRSARISGASVAGVSLHGTGTPLGDPIEMGALLAGLGLSADRQGPLVLGASKVRNPE